MVQQSDKPCVILLSMGGPETTADVREFLYNIFCDRSLIRLPGGRFFQRSFARLISSLRCSKVQRHYDSIGGGSPLLMWTTKQAAQIERLLNRKVPGVRCLVGMRYFHPLIEDTLAAALEAGSRRFIFLPMYPQFSRATTGSSFQVVRRITEGREVECIFIDDFHDDPGYTRLLKEHIDVHISADETLLFSAHSLPQRFVDEGDPYVQQVRISAGLAAGDREYALSYQSRTGPVKWVGPDTIVEARRLLSDPRKKLFVVPLSFVCDHIETLYEIDIDLRQQLGADGSRIRRMPMLNGNPGFSEVLADIVTRKGGLHGLG
ncbi:MAG: ferrochelatase [candidate division Zixibacteria bacterium]|nr:ferrochelatase [candidate division Zixibacteria bacterium]MDH3937802.1 ferrochelatase [candidate division Zixibacteria bacterium]MDH4035285.1 ferrochelatase [candidate division Zixibacteria bacterium]